MYISTWIHKLNIFLTFMLQFALWKLHLKCWNSLKILFKVNRKTALQNVKFSKQSFQRKMSINELLILSDFKARFTLDL